MARLPGRNGSRQLTTCRGGGEEGGGGEGSVGSSSMCRARALQQQNSRGEELVLGPPAVGKSWALDIAHVCH